MGANTPERFTMLLRRWKEGNEEAENTLISIVYPELKKLASRYLRGERQGHTLQPTALVHEAYMRLAGNRADWKDRAHFFALATSTMRRILVDYARAHQSQKRGGSRIRITFDEARLAGPSEGMDMLDLDKALRQLAEIDERKARIVELHFFAGMTFIETAEALRISESTVTREMRFAKAWLHTNMKDSHK